MSLARNCGSIFQIEPGAQPNWSTDLLGYLVDGGSLYRCKDICLGRALDPLDVIGGGNVESCAL